MSSCFSVQNVESYMSQIGQILKMEIEESKSAFASLPVTP